MNSEFYLFVISVISISCLLFPFFAISEAFSLHIIHYNDFHARYMPIDFEGKECTQEDEEKELCFGGFARLKTMVDELQSLYNNSILLNVGDYSQGTLWNTVYEWRATSYFMNKIKHTALGIGVHELDYGPEGFVPYMDNIKFPFICCNIDSSNVSSMENKYSKSIVVEVDGEKVGIIGYLSTLAKFSANPGLLEIGDEIECIEEEARRLKTEFGVKIIIACGSAGYQFDQNIARLIDIDVVVGGRSHTFLYSGTQPATETPMGPYPTVVLRRDSSFGLVTQAYCYGKYLGYLRVDFDSDGGVETWDGNPILLDSTIIPDPKIEEELTIWRENLTATMNIEVGISHVFLDGRVEGCRMRECNIGNILADAMVFESLKYANDFEWSYASLAVINTGGIRDTFDPREHNGIIRMSHIYSMFPYKNAVAFVEIKGEYLKAAFEYSVSDLPYGPNSNFNGRFLQVSGFKVEADLCKPRGHRILSIFVLCGECLLPTYSQLQEDYYYRVVMSEFIARGGDGYSVIADNIISFQSTGIVDSDAFVEYVKARGPLITGVEQRIIISGLNGCKANSSVSLNASQVMLYLIYAIVSLSVMLLLVLFTE